jgi:phosphate transport system permease protein
LGLKGGIRPAIEGSIALVLIGLAFSLPIAIGGAIYMAEYGRTQSIIKALRFGAECLAAIPSIVYGLFGYSFLVVFLSLKVSLLAGGITLGFVMFPVILIGAQEAIEAVEDDLRESSLALGVTRAYALRKVILTKAWPGIIAITVITAGHAFGSAAPILYTASVIYSRWSLDLSMPVMTLPTHLYYLLSEALSFQHAFGTAFVLVVVLLSANIMAMLLKKLVRR